MVEFLLHNSIGAWWAGKQGPIRAETEAQARAGVALPERDGLPAVKWDYLRFIQDEDGTWRPAAGTFDGWPRRAAEIRFLDPCMGSGHFLVFVLPILARLRLQEEGLAAAEAIAAVLRDNLHGLEIDERCTQIAAFNVALTAWRLGAYQALPAMHLACSGLAPHASKQAWMDLADRAADFVPVSPERDLFGAENNLFTARLRAGMERLYDLFRQAPVLGSLIDPRAIGGDLVTADFNQLQPILEQALARETDDSRRELAVTAQGLTKAAEILAGRFTLVATNVPYLGRKKQHEVLMDYSERVHPDAKADLATCFVERCLNYCARNASTALVTPQNWLFLGGYKKLRQRLLEEAQWDCIARLGSGAFETISGEIVNVSLVSLSGRLPAKEHFFASIDVSEEKAPSRKDESLANHALTRLSQNSQLRNPDARISAKDHHSGMPQLGECSECYQGVVTGDLERFRVQFWEFSDSERTWRPFRTTIDRPNRFGGLNAAIKWQGGNGELHEYAAATRKQLHDMHESGNRAWGRLGVAINRMGDLAATAYLEEIFDNNVAVVIPKKEQDLPALLAFCTSLDFSELVRSLDQTIKVTNRTLIKIPFDLEHWQQVAAEKYPNGLPKPHSDDPSQWLFNGHPKGSEQPLQVAVARLMGYRWPRQTGSEFPDCPALGPDGLEGYVDADGIVCLPPINKEQPAAARLRNLLAASFGADWSPSRERDLLAATGAKQTNLEDWLRDAFFEQHCKLFHNRPFIWHLWDGRKDGFHALVNYHRLDNAALQKLTYSYLGDWIRQQ